MYARYAVYFSPADSSPLARFGSNVLGRTATEPRSSHAQSTFHHPQRWQALTRKPAHYGFHATLKAPFVLCADRSESDLQTSCEVLAGQLMPVSLDTLAPRSVKGFAALTLGSPSAAVDDLAKRCVVELEHCRAPISDYDFNRKLNEHTSERQESQLRHYGYPYIFDDFYFHMTLSKKLALPEDDDYLLWLDDQFAQYIDSTPVLDRLALFAQTTREQPFIRIAEFPLTS